MDDTQIKLFNKVIASCIDCGGDPGGPYWTSVGATEEVILDFLRTFCGYKMGIRYIPFEKIEVFRIEKED